MTLDDTKRVRRLMGNPNHIFVFGSNLEGVHGKGAALEAKARYGAKQGQGVGRQGAAYAIPTKVSWRSRKGMPVHIIAEHVNVFLLYARMRSDLTFVLTRIGCGYAGYQGTDIAPLFRFAPKNVILPTGWAEIIERENAQAT